VFKSAQDLIALQAETPLDVSMQRANEMELETTLADPGLLVTGHAMPTVILPKSAAGGRTLLSEDGSSTVLKSNQKPLDASESLVLKSAQDLIVLQAETPLFVSMQRADATVFPTALLTASPTTIPTARPTNRRQVIAEELADVSCAGG
jgi:hypothetical protein